LASIWLTCWFGSFWTGAIDGLAELAAHFETGPILRREKRYARCLIGKDVVDWLALLDLVGNPIREFELAPIALDDIRRALDLIAGRRNLALAGYLRVAWRRHDERAATKRYCEQVLD
jgi:hypothetical protein